MKWIRPKGEKYFITSDPAGYNICRIFLNQCRRVELWNSVTKEFIAARNVHSLEQERAGVDELKAIAEGM